MSRSSNSATWLTLLAASALVGIAGLTVLLRGATTAEGMVMGRCVRESRALHARAAHLQAALDRVVAGLVPLDQRPPLEPGISPRTGESQ